MRLWASFTFSLVFLIHCSRLRAATTNTAKCQWPEEHGPCRSYFTRWYFNMISLKCEPFIYGGCKGNENNFKTKFQCMQVCGTLVPCIHPKDGGSCKTFRQRWFYNSTSKSCESFKYGGCGGNINNFHSKKECVSICNGQD